MKTSPRSPSINELSNDKGKKMSSPFIYKIAVWSTFHNIQKSDENIVFDSFFQKDVKFLFYLMNQFLISGLFPNGLYRNFIVCGPMYAPINHWYWSMIVSISRFITVFITFQLLLTVHNRPKQQQHVLLLLLEWGRPTYFNLFPTYFYLLINGFLIQSFLCVRVGCLCSCFFQ